jgi:hypothetical protein
LNAEGVGAAWFILASQACLLSSGSEAWTKDGCAKDGGGSVVSKADGAIAAPGPSSSAESSDTEESIVAASTRDGVTAGGTVGRIGVEDTLDEAELDEATSIDPPCEGVNGAGCGKADPVNADT